MELKPVIHPAAYELVGRVAAAHQRMGLPARPYTAWPEALKAAYLAAYEATASLNLSA